VFSVPEKRTQHKVQFFSANFCRWVIAIAFVFATFIGKAQVEWHLELDGMAFDGEKKLAAGTVILKLNGAEVSRVITPASGKFSFNLEPDKEYYFKQALLPSRRKTIGIRLHQRLGTY